jgi:hypothetical protein
MRRHILDPQTIGTAGLRGQANSTLYALERREYLTLLTLANDANGIATAEYNHSYVTGEPLEKYHRHLVF